MFSRVQTSTKPSNPLTSRIALYDGSASKITTTTPLQPHKIPTTTPNQSHKIPTTTPPPSTKTAAERGNGRRVGEGLMKFQNAVNNVNNVKKGTLVSSFLFRFFLV